MDVALVSEYGGIWEGKQSPMLMGMQMGCDWTVQNWLHSLTTYVRLVIQNWYLSSRKPCLSYLNGAYPTTFYDFYKMHMSPILDISLN